MEDKIDVMYLNENIRSYPAEIGDLTDKMFALGDLHGNAMKLFYVLLRYGVFNLPNKADFDEAWLIYDKPVAQLTREDLSKFEEIVNSAEVKLPGLINFIGDEFADRGQNDFFTALVFKKMHDNKVPYRIQLSNHASYLLSYLEKGTSILKPLISGQTNSLDNYIYLKNLFPGVAEKMNALLDHAYKDHLCLMGYAQSDAEHPFLISHAPIDGLTIPGLSKQFGITIDEPPTPEKIIQFIDQINFTIATFITQGQLTDHILATPSYLKWDKMKPTAYEYATQKTDPIYDVIWNRHSPRALLPCGFLNIHGHVGENNQKDLVHYINLDSDWGKPSEPVYDRDNNLLGIIPADDIRPSPVLIATISPCDRLSPFFRDASAWPPDVLADEYSITESDTEFSSAKSDAAPSSTTSATEFSSTKSDAAPSITSSVVTSHEDFDSVSSRTTSTTASFKRKLNESHEVQALEGEKTKTHKP